MIDFAVLCEKSGHGGIFEKVRTMKSKYESMQLIHEHLKKKNNIHYKNAVKCAEIKYRNNGQKKKILIFPFELRDLSI